MSRTHYLKCACQQCGEHIEFPADGLGMKILCPHCGGQTQLISEKVPLSPQKKIILAIAIIAVIVIIGLAATAFFVLKKMPSDNVTVPATVPTAPAPAPPAEALPPGYTAMNDFQVSPVTLKKSEGSSLVYAVGTVKNNTSRQRFGVKIHLDMLDNQGQSLGDTSDYISVLEPHKDWSFKALLTNPKAAAVKLTEVEEQK